MTRVSTEARSRTTTEWVASNISVGRRYSPPWGVGSDEISSAEYEKRWLAATTNCCPDTRLSGPTSVTR